MKYLLVPSVVVGMKVELDGTDKNQSREKDAELMQLKVFTIRIQPQKNNGISFFLSQNNHSRPGAAEKVYRTFRSP